jgi:type IV pilus assembly protein PilW
VKRAACFGHREAAGFSLVEMMVAMVISLIALGAVGSLYLSSSQAARFHDAVQRVQENGRFATDMMSRSLRMARYRDPINVQPAPAEWIRGTATSSGTPFTVSGLKASGDTVAVTFQGGTNLRDCQGRTVATNLYVTNLYGISTANQLVCASRLSSGTTNAPVSLAEGVEDMVVLYGLDIDATPDGIADRYVPPGNVTNWNQVVSMRITLLVNSVDDAQRVATTICMGCVVFAGTSDRLVRAEFETTIGLRNPAST